MLNYSTFNVTQSKIVPKFVLSFYCYCRNIEAESMLLQSQMKRQETYFKEHSI